MYTKEQLSDLFAKSQAILSLSDSEKNALLEKMLLLPEEGQQAVIDILAQEQKTIAAIQPSVQAAELIEKRNRLTAIENALKHNVMTVQEAAEKNEADLDQILTQLN